MPRYELIALFPGSVSEEEVPAQVAAVREEITKRGGSIVDESTLGRRKLAYPIEKHHHGTYHVFRFDAEDGSKLAELGTALKLKAEVLRHMVLSVPIVSAEKLEARRELQEKIRTRKTLAAVHAAQVEAAAEVAKVSPEKAAAKEEKKISLEELDEKIEELLGKEMMK
jgi:small subunit ribosomal protein S6